MNEVATTREEVLARLSSFKEARRVDVVRFCEQMNPRLKERILREACHLQ